MGTSRKGVTHVTVTSASSGIVCVPQAVLILFSGSVSCIVIMFGILIGKI